MASKFLIVFDFDHTILDDNADTSLFNLIGNREEAVDLWNQYEEGKWTEFMNKVVTFLHSRGVSVDDIKNELIKLPLVNGMSDLLNFIGTHPQLECIVLSDANTMFIETVLEARGLRSFVKKIISNPAVVDESGKVVISPCHSHNHRKCPPNMCKGTLLQEFQQHTGENYLRVCYVGDGSNDLCPCLSLTSKDYAFPRKDYSLEKKIDNLQNSDSVQAKVVKWESGLEILNQLQTIIGS